MIYFWHILYTPPIIYVISLQATASLPTFWAWKWIVSTLQVEAELVGRKLIQPFLEVLPRRQWGGLMVITDVPSVVWWLTNTKSAVLLFAFRFFGKLKDGAEGRYADVLVLSYLEMMVCKRWKSVLGNIMVIAKACKSYHDILYCYIGNITQEQCKLFNLILRVIVNRNYVCL